MLPPAPTGSVRESVDRMCRFRRIAGGGFRAALEITRRCNLACLHCFVPNKRQDPALPSLQEIIGELGRAGCRKVLLTGGEPLLRQDLEDIIRTATAAGLGVDLNSNLVDLSPQRADALVHAGLGEASVSFYGDADFHDQFVRKPGSYQSALRSCSLLRERGVDLDIHGPIWAGNLPFAELTYDMACRLGAGSLTFFKVIAPADTQGGRLLGGTRFGARARQFAPPDAGELFRVVRGLRDRGALPVRTIGFRGHRDEECEQGCSIVALTSDLSLSPCLLSRQRNPVPHQVNQATVQATLALLREEVAAGMWKPVCDVATESEGGAEL
jgi:hypothetical protein